MQHASTVDAVCSDDDGDDDFHHRIWNWKLFQLIVLSMSIKYPVKVAKLILDISFTIYYATVSHTEYSIGLLHSITIHRHNITALFEFMFMILIQKQVFWAQCDWY